MAKIAVFGTPVDLNVYREVLPGFLSIHNHELLDLNPKDATISREALSRRTSTIGSRVASRRASSIVPGGGTGKGVRRMSSYPRSLSAILAKNVKNFTGGVEVKRGERGHPRLGFPPWNSSSVSSSLDPSPAGSPSESPESSPAPSGRFLFATGGTWRRKSQKGDSIQEEKQRDRSRGLLSPEEEKEKDSGATSIGSVGTPLPLATQHSLSSLLPDATSLSTLPTGLSPEAGKRDIGGGKSGSRTALKISFFSLTESPTEKIDALIFIGSSIVGGTHYENVTRIVREATLLGFEGLVLALCAGVEKDVEQRHFEIFDHIFSTNYIDQAACQAAVGALRSHYLPALSFLYSIPPQYIPPRRTGLVRDVCGIFISKSSPRYFTSLIKVCVEIYKFYDITLYTLENDASHLRSLATSLIPVGVSARVEKGGLTTREVIAKIGNLSFALCVDYHSHIFATICSVPFFSIALTVDVEREVNHINLSTFQWIDAPGPIDDKKLTTGVRNAILNRDKIVDIQVRFTATARLLLDTSKPSRLIGCSLYRNASLLREIANYISELNRGEIEISASAGSTLRVTKHHVRGYVPLCFPHQSSPPSNICAPNPFIQQTVQHVTDSISSVVQVGTNAVSSTLQALPSVSISAQVDVSASVGGRGFFEGGAMRSSERSSSTATEIAFPEETRVEFKIYTNCTGCGRRLGTYKCRHCSSLGVPFKCDCGKITPCHTCGRSGEVKVSGEFILEELDIEAPLNPTIATHVSRLICYRLAGTPHSGYIFGLTPKILHEIHDIVNILCYLFGEIKNKHHHHNHGSGSCASSSGSASSSTSCHTGSHGSSSMTGPGSVFASMDSHHREIVSGPSGGQTLVSATRGLGDEKERKGKSRKKKEDGKTGTRCLGGRRDSCDSPRSESDCCDSPRDDSCCDSPRDDCCHKIPQGHGSGCMTSTTTSPSFFSRNRRDECGEESDDECCSPRERDDSPRRGGYYRGRGIGGDRGKQGGSRGIGPGFVPLPLVAPPLHPLPLAPPVPLPLHPLPVAPHPSSSSSSSSSSTSSSTGESSSSLLPSSLPLLHPLPLQLPIETKLPLRPPPGKPSDIQIPLIPLLSPLEPASPTSSVSSLSSPGTSPGGDDRKMPFYFDIKEYSEYKGIHISGWYNVVRELSQYVTSGERTLDLYVDRTFLWCLEINKYLGILPYSSWAGFIHHTDDTGHSENNIVAMFKTKEFLQSLHRCDGLFALSDSLGAKLESRLDRYSMPAVVEVYPHPTEIPRDLWNVDNFLRDPGIINIGCWYRKPFSIHLLKPKVEVKVREVGYPTTLPIRKLSLRGKGMDNFFIPSDFAIQEWPKDPRWSPQGSGSGNGLGGGNKWIEGLIRYLAGVKEILRFSYDYSTSILYLESKEYKKQVQSLKDVIESVQCIQFLPDEEYNLLRQRYIFFLDLESASAVNTLMEAVASNTPILVNRLPSIVEIVGEGYPLLYNNLEEGSKLLTLENILAAHEHLKSLDKRRYAMEYFVEKIASSKAWH